MKKLEFRNYSLLTILTMSILMMINHSLKAQINTDIEYRIINAATKKALSIENSSKNDHAKVVQWDFKNRADQKWKLIPRGGAYILLNVHSGKAISLPGDGKRNDYKEAKLYTNLKGGDQVWNLNPEKNGTYTITSPLSKKALCLPGGGKGDNGKVVKLYTNLKGGDQRWIFEPFNKVVDIDKNKEYVIVNLATKKALSIENSSTNDLAKVVQWNLDYRADQKWKLIPHNNGYILLNVNSGKVISLPGDGKRNDYKEAKLYTNLKGGDQVWNLNPEKNGTYTITSPLSKKALCLPGGGKGDNGKAVKLYTNLKGGDQLWRLQPFIKKAAPPKIVNGYYQLKTHHNTYLQVKPNGEVAASPNSSTWETFEVKVVGTNKIQLRSYHGSFLQAKADGTVSTTSNSRSWETFTLISKGGNKYVLKTAHNNHIQADPNKKVGTSPNSSTWETFSFNKVAELAATSETGFRVLVNGMHCTSAASSTGSDMVWVEFYVDGAGSPVIKTEKLLMNSNDQKYQSRFGSVYAENSVKLKVYNTNGLMGELTINKEDRDNNYINRALTGSGIYDITLTKVTRKDPNPKYVGLSSSIKLRIPILNQGQESSCVAFSVVAALTHAYYQTIDRNGKQKTELFDPKAFYRRRGTNSEGWHINKALNKLVLEGIPFKADPSKRLYLKGYYKLTKGGQETYYSKDGNSVSSKNSRQTSLKNGDLMRNALQRGAPLLANYKVYEDFDLVDMSATKSNNSVYGGRATNNFEGNHAIVVTGYSTPDWRSNDVSYWLLQNSWGSHSGVNGLYMFAEGACGFDDVMYKLGGFEVR